MHNLTPEKRLDKNGRLVTKHVKTNTGSSLSNMSVPAPSLPVDPRAKNIAMIVEPLRAHSTRVGLAQFSMYLESCQSQTLEAAAEAISSNSEAFVSQVVSEATRKRNEGFLLLVASSANVWTAVASWKADGDGTLSEGAVSDVTNTMWDVYKKMTPYDDMYTLYASLSSRDAEDFNVEESIESFKLEYLGDRLGIGYHTRMNRDYYRKLELLSNDLDGVGEAMHMLLEINKSLYVLEDGHSVDTVLTSEQVMSIVGLSKKYPERIGSLVDFIKKRNSYDGDAAEAFLKADAASLSSGIL